MKCCFCGKSISTGGENSILPIKFNDDKRHVCCHDCNLKIIIPTRLNIREILSHYKLK